MQLELGRIAEEDLSLRYVEQRRSSLSGMNAVVLTFEVI
jgi:hypothetical protein